MNPTWPTSPDGRSTTRGRRFATRACAALALLATAAVPSGAATYALTRTAVAGGGLSPTGAGPYTLTATLSQAASGPLAGGAYTLSAGFLHPRTLPNVDTPPLSARPTRVAFLPVQPNPARGALTLAFELPAEALVRLDVLSVDGRRVATLTSRRFEAGRHAIRWSGTDDVGAPVAPGIYLASFTSGTSRLSRRFVLLDR